MWLAATVSYGFPSLRGVHDDLAASIGQHSTAVLNARCTHVAGDYWFVWKTVYHVNLLKYECGETEILWGVAWRGRHAWPRWRDMPPEQMRMGALPENREYAEWQLAVFGLLPVEVAEEHLDLIVFRRGLEN